MRYILISIRVFLLVIMAILWLVCGLFVCLLRPMHKSNVYALTQMLTLAQPILGVRVIMHFDIKDVRKMMPAVFVGLHQSNFDIVTMAHLPQPGLVCVGKKSLLYTPIFGILFFLSGNILLDREKRSKAGETFLQIVKRIKKGQSIWMFPEGTRSKFGPVGKFKTGALHTAMLAKVPVIPFVTSTYAGQIDLGRFNNGEIHIKLLDPIDGKDLERSQINDMTHKLREKMIMCMHEMDKNVVRPKGYVMPKDR